MNVWFQGVVSVNAEVVVAVMVSKIKLPSTFVVRITVLNSVVVDVLAGREIFE